MEIILRAAAAAVTGSILALLLRRHTPEVSLVLGLCCGVFVAWLCVGICRSVAEAAKDLIRMGELSPAAVAPVLKCVGIGLVTQLGAQLCRDAGQGAAASFLELCGTLCGIYVSLPLLRALRDIHARGMLHWDIAPENITVTPRRQAMLLGFGEWSSAAPDHSCAPPELAAAQGGVGPWSDVYADRKSVV